MNIDDMIEKKEVEQLDDDKEQVQQRASIDWSFLKTPTGDGELSDYMNHPLNFNNSKGLARIIRGTTGFVGNMNYALLDIFFGLLDFAKPKVVKPVDSNQIH